METEVTPSPTMGPETPSSEPMPAPEPPAVSEHKPPPDRRLRPFVEPLPDVFPFALRYCKQCHRGFEISRSGVRWGLACAFGIGVPSGLLLGTGALLWLFLSFAGFCAASYVILHVLHVALLTFFFAKYSLGQFMSVLLLAGFGVSLLVELEGEWRILPAIGLAVLFGVVLVYVGSYDPIAGNSVIPRAARETLFNPPDAPKPPPDPILSADERTSSA